MRAVANAVAAEADGCDAFLIGHFQDSGLHDARSAVGIPVLGLGETSMLHACTVGQRIGLVTIDPIFMAWHQEQIARYGLRERVIGVTAMTRLTVEDYVRACEDEDAFARVFEQFERAAVALLAAGAEVLIPAGGLPALVLSRRPGLEVDGAAVLNPVPVLAKHGEAAVLLGGTSFAGGIGGVGGTAIGVAFLATLQQGLSISGVQDYWQQIITGVILIVVVLLDRIQHGGLESIGLGRLRVRRTQAESPPER